MINSKVDLILILQFVIIIMFLMWNGLVAFVAILILRKNKNNKEAQQNTQALPKGKET